MAILVNGETRVIVQGITGHQGSFHAKSMKEFGTKVVGGVTPGKGGSDIDGMPVFDTVMEAVSETGANASCIFVPARFAKDAVLEAINAGIALVTVITEHIPFLDALQFTSYAKLKGAVVIGPNCPGVTSPGYGKIGIMPSKIFARGDVGVISRSGTLTYEIVNELTEKGFGETT